VRVIAPRSYRSPTFFRYLALAWRALAVRGRFDGVEVHWLFPTGLIGLLAARMRAIPLVVYAHGDDVKTTPNRSRLHRWLVRSICMRADAVVTNSSDTARYIRALGREAEVIPTGVDLTSFKPTPRPDRRRVLYLGGDVPGKGFDIAQSLADTCLGPGLDERHPNEIPALMGAHDVVLVPSDDEAFGLVAAEAIASGRWVVANAVGGLREVVIDGVNGTLVNDGDYATAIARIPDYDPFAIARTAQRFDSRREDESLAGVWEHLVAVRN
jgi:D-inositol-3-phosphate glycosyltransferase